MAVWAVMAIAQSPDERVGECADVYGLSADALTDSVVDLSKITYIDDVWRHNNDDGRTFSYQYSGRYRMDFDTDGDSLMLNRIEGRNRFLQFDSAVVVSRDGLSPFTAHARSFIHNHHWIEGIKYTTTTNIRRLIVDEGLSIDNARFRLSRLYYNFGVANKEYAPIDSAEHSGVFSIGYFLADTLSYPVAIALWEEHPDSTSAHEPLITICRFTDALESLKASQPGVIKLNEPSNVGGEHSITSLIPGYPEGIVTVTDRGAVSVTIPSEIADEAQIAVVDPIGRVFYSAMACGNLNTSISLSPGYYLLYVKWPTGEYQENIIIQ